MSQDDAKDAASLKALDYVRDGMRVGLGTGSTAAHFISHLIERCQAGLKIEAVATSIASEQQAKAGGIPLLDVNEVTAIDVTVDGADEVDPQKRLIKGAGGALVREKIIAAMGKEMIVIADKTKMVDRLGKMPLPIEIIPFGAESIRTHLKEMGFTGQWRKESNKRYVTDNQNWILDIVLSHPLEDPEEAHRKMLTIPGVVDTGFFFNLATRIIVGKDDGTAMVIE